MKQALRNLISVGSADVLSRVLGFVATAYLARVLGTTSFGVMSIGMSVLGYAIILSSPGLHIMGTRDVASGSDVRKGLPGNIITIRMLLSVLFIGVTSVLCLLVVDDPLTRTVTILFSLSALPLAFSLDWYFQGKERFDVVSVGKVLMYIVYLLFILFLVSDGSDVKWAAVAFGIAHLVSSSWLFFIFKKNAGSLSPGWRPGSWGTLLSESLPLGITWFLTSTIMNLPVLLAGIMLSSGDAGILNASMKLVFFVLVIDRVFYALFLPAVSRHSQYERGQFLRVANLGVRAVVILSIPIAVIGMAFSDRIVELVYGEGFEVAALPLRILLVYFVFTVVNTALMSILIAQKREREIVRAMIIGTSTLILVSLSLPGFIGLAGIAAGLSIGEGVMSIMMLRSVRKSVLGRVGKLFLPAFGGGLLMYFVISSLATISVPIVMGLGVASFVVALVLLGGVTREDYTFIRERFL